MLFTTAVLGGCLTTEDGGSFNDGATNTTDSNSNRVPAISGSPPSAAMVGETYSFTPTASDPDGDALTFSIDNKPNWANFDNQSGTLSGTPTIANIGQVGNIRISVSDGQASSALAPFTVEVTQSALGSIQLSWSAPTANADGSALTDLAGYKLYYGRQSRQYTNVIRIDNASITTYLVDNLVPNTYFFAATAFNSAGTESVYSSEAVRTVN